MAVVPFLPNLGSGSFAGASLPVEPTTTTVDVTISPSVSITSGNTYAIVTYGSGASALNHVSITQDTAAGYANGTRCQSTSGGADGTWSSISTRDTCFTTYESGTPKDTFTTTDSVLDHVPTYYFAQTFTASSSYTLDQIRFTCSKSTSSDPGTVLVYVREAAAEASKASNPDPANGSGPGIDFSDDKLEWTGDGDTYDVYAGAGGNFVKVADGISDATYTLSAADQLLCQDGIVSWRVDSINAAGTTTGDTWTFDPRPGKASAPTPSDTGSDIELTQVFSWTGGDYQTSNNLVIDDSTYLSSASTSWTPDADAFSWDSSISWRVDSVNDYGTTTGDTWTFDSIALDHLQVTWEAINGGSGPYDGGVEGTDFYYTGLNNVITVKRLVCAAKDTFYYETL